MFLKFFVLSLCFFLSSLDLLSQNTKTNTPLFQATKFHRDPDQINSRLNDVRFFIYNSNHLTKALSLDNIQKDSITLLNEPFFSYLQESLYKLEDINSELVFLHENTYGTLNEISKKIKSKYDLQAEIELRSIVLEREIIKLLNKEQRIRFINIINDFKINS